MLKCGGRRVRYNTYGGRQRSHVGPPLRLFQVFRGRKLLLSVRVLLYRFLDGRRHAGGRPRLGGREQQVPPGLVGADRRQQIEGFRAHVLPHQFVLVRGGPAPVGRVAVLHEVHAQDVQEQPAGRGRADFAGRLGRFNLGGLLVVRLGRRRRRGRPRELRQQGHHRRAHGDVDATVRGVVPGALERIQDAYHGLARGALRWSFLSRRRRGLGGRRPELVRRPRPARQGRVQRAAGVI